MVRGDLHPAAGEVTSSRGMVPSLRTASTAVWPHAATMPGPVKRAGGKVTLPWAATEAAKRETTAEAAEAIEVFIVYFCVLVLRR